LGNRIFYLIPNGENQEGFQGGDGRIFPSGRWLYNFPAKSGRVEPEV
jgi:hypothetical protein